MTFPTGRPARLAPGAGAAARAGAAEPPGVWAATGQLPFAGFWGRPADAAVLLADGRVLLAGGEDGRRHPTAATAVYDPAAGTWSAVGSMWTPRRLHTVTPLADGRLLAVGGIGHAPDGPAAGLATAELYDPATGRWTPTTGSLRQARFSHSATRLPDGRVLVAGGATARPGPSPHTLRSAELYDPVTGQWTQTRPMTDARFGHPAVPLVDGRVLLVGGVLAVGRGHYGALGYCETYDPATGAWTPTGTLATARKGHQATLLADGGVLVTGGDMRGFRSDDWAFDPYSQWLTERFDPARGTWSADTDMPWGRSHHRAVLLRSGQVLVIGGTDDVSLAVGYQNALVYDPAARTWSTEFGTVEGRWAPAAIRLGDGRVLAAGGLTRSGPAAPVHGEDEVTATTEIYTPTTEIRTPNDG
ncbi:Kelch repeat-containing protein [Streptomyces exfoliatus]|uniref:Kelch repeat-containing protein n=1 Tax=Streptomyces exfoliatus TaxID=1905 RepID=UPI0004644F3C|nr:kelch repeat-containing protein [Streptomyces exfoliatus]